MNLDLLHALSEAPGPSGREQAVRDILRDHLRDRVDALSTDVLGNLIATRRAARSDSAVPAPRVLVAAHMDEAGLMVVQIDGSGLLRVRPAGHIDVRTLLGKTLRIGPDRVPGVVGLAPVHLLHGDGGRTLPDIDSVTIDIGADSRSAAQALVKRGDFAVFDTEFGRVGRLIKGKALDNRAGVALAAALFDAEYPCDLHVAFTVQEGAGARGARVAAYAVEPAAAFIVDAVGVDEIVESDDPPPRLRLGHGPAVVLSDRGVVADPGLTERLRTSAASADLPYQIYAGTGRGEGRTVHVARTGVPTALLGIPARYPNTPVTLMDPSDLDAAFSLLKLTLRGLGDRSALSSE